MSTDSAGSPRGARRLAWVVFAGLVAWSGPALAGEPRLDLLASERGIGAGELDIGARVVVPAGSAARRVSAERRSLTLHGLPLRGAFETVWNGDGGQVGQGGEGTGGEGTVVASRYPASDAQLRPDQASIDLARARELVAPRLRPDQLAKLGKLDQLGQLDGELVYLMLLGTPMLAWELTAPLSLGDVHTPPSRERVWVSAADGRILDAVELVDFDGQAEVYDINPQHTPTPSLATLTNLDPEPPPWAEGMSVEPGYLTGTRVRVFNCIDAEDGPYAPWWEEGECFATQQVHADDNNDYFVPLPDVSLIGDNINPTDLYAELSMYWHAEKFFTFMATLGVEEFPCELSNMVANFHWLEPAPDFPQLDFGPLNNAYFSGVCDIEAGPTMTFGQGSAVDFAFDGDVVYHELGHGIVAQLTPEGLRDYNLRSDGVLRDARAINEGLADYHSLMLTGRPELAEYVGYYWPELGRAWVRFADNDATCPGHMAGQEHNDSAPFTAALWAARRRIGGDKLDPVVIAALPLLARDATLEQASAALLSIASAEREAGIWTALDYDQLERALATRNLLDCERVIDDPASETEARFMYLRNNGNYVSPFWPGPVQFRQRIPADSDNLLMTFEVSTPGTSDGQPVNHDVEPWVLLKRSSVSEDAPLSFEYEIAALGAHDEDNGTVNQTWEVFGDWDEIYTPTVLGEARRQVLIRGLEPGEVVHLSFVSSDRDIIVVRELFFSSVPTDELDGGSPGEGREPEIIDEDDGSSCACTIDADGGKRRGLAAPLVLLVLAVGRRSRRR